MCKFFSVVSNGHGTIFYFDAKTRLELKNNNPEGYEHDSHSSICTYFNLTEDKCNKYEFNPFTKVFKIDQLNNEDDSAHVEKQVRNLDFNPIFETGLFDIDLSSLESLDGIEFPEKCKFINLFSLEKLENFTFPKECKKIVLRSCRELNNVIFPEKCDFIDLNDCIELKNVTFPKKCDTLNLSSLLSLKDIELPEKSEYLYLNSINSSEVVLPKKHGYIKFKNKTLSLSKFL